jgi:hypothetical protein
MLRAVQNSSYVINARPCNVPAAPLPEITIQKMQFIEHDFGDCFDRVYLSDTQNILHAFPRLNEDNRSFFLALGIGVGVDPFVLQCLFRVHAQRLQKNAISESEPMKSQIRQVLQPGHAIDDNILSWCWPPEFNGISVQIIDKNGDIALFENDNGKKSKNVILKKNRHGHGYKWQTRKRLRPRRHLGRRGAGRKKRQRQPGSRGAGRHKRQRKRAHADSRAAEGRGGKSSPRLHRP